MATSPATSMDHPGSASAAVVAAAWHRGRTELARISPEAGDALLYFGSAVFALITIYTSENALYQVWGRMALSPFVFGAFASTVVAVLVRRARRRAAGDGTGTEATSPGRLSVRQHHRAWVARIVIAACVFVGALAIPMGLEILWRFDGVPGSHLQPEVTSVEIGGQDLLKGTDPYHKITRSRHEVPYHAPGEPDYAGFLPYLPLMAVAGIPSDIWPNSGLSDARIFFCLITLVVAAVALYLCKVEGRRKIRALQALVILPLASLPLATGGDDIPVVAILLLAMVLAQRRQPFASGFVLGVASAMKFTAWPLAVLALFCAWDRHGRRRPWLMLGGMVVVAVPTIFPFALQGPFALIDDVVLFPLGLSAIPSTAASALPGHVLVTWFPSLSRALPLGVGLILGVFLCRHLYKHTPRSVAQVCNLAGVVMAVLILLAPNPRVGYLLYPINFFVWAYLLAEPASHDSSLDDDGLLRVESSLAGAAAGAGSSAS